MCLKRMKGGSHRESKRKSVGEGLTPGYGGRGGGRGGGDCPCLEGEEGERSSEEEADRPRLFVHS